MNSSLTPISWRKFIDEDVNPRATLFLDQHGEEVLSEIATITKTASDSDASQIAILIHPNASSIAVITNEEYVDVLTICLRWFEKKELYEKCANIQKDINAVVNKPIKKRKLSKQKK